VEKHFSILVFILSTSLFTGDLPKGLLKIPNRFIQVNVNGGSSLGAMDVNMITSINNTSKYASNVGSLLQKAQVTILNSNDRYEIYLTTFFDGESTFVFYLEQPIETSFILNNSLYSCNSFWYSISLSNETIYNNILMPVNDDGTTYFIPMGSLTQK